MREWRHLLTQMGLGSRQADSINYTALMQKALMCLRLAELKIREACSLEELDLGRAMAQQALAEVQHLVRKAKLERGVPVRSIFENEELHRQMLDCLARRRSPGRRTPRTQAG